MAEKDGDEGGFSVFCWLRKVRFWGVKGRLEVFLGACGRKLNHVHTCFGLRPNV